VTKIGDLPDGEFQAPALILDGVVPFPDMEVAITLADEKNKAAIDVALEQQHLVAYIPKSQQSNYEKTIGTLTLRPPRLSLLKSLDIDRWREA